MLVCNFFPQILIFKTFSSDSTEKICFILKLGAGYGLTQIKEGLERRKLSKDDSYSVKFFDLEDEFYREFPYRIQVILTGDLNYSDPNTQNEIEKLTEAFESTSYVTSSLYTESWLRTFLDFLDRNREFLNVTINSEQDFINAMKEVTI